ncbi:MAG TPA: flagellar motor protein MotB [Geminicoccaceae bacterium]|nr:flagellar motor protein MotB [Geminicoccaceae bacterium]
MSSKAEAEGRHAAPIIVRKRAHGTHEAHHGGAWKVAYADFVTAMMAFFLLMWLLGATTEDQRKGIADYFAGRVPISPESAGGEGVLEGGFVPRTPEARFRLGDRDRDDVALAAGAPSTTGPSDSRHDERIERQRFETIQSEILRRLEASAALRELAGNLMFELTPEGLRIHIFDRSGADMFPLGSAVPRPHTAAILEVIADIIGAVRNGVVITGHTDSRPFVGSGPYGNWELSSDRANAARRVLATGGVAAERFRRIEGRAALEPLIEDDSTDPRNRRITITLLRTTQSARPEGEGARAPNTSLSSNR